jgi:ribosomal protein S18 acetylase RimI-like enzyme
MSEAANYSALERLRDGRRAEIRAFRPDDQADMLAAVGQLSNKSLSRRFFVPKRELSQKEIAFFSDVDFVKHVALVAVIEDGGRRSIVGGGRYIVCQPKRAEVAFGVVDQFQGQGVGAALLRHLATLAQAAGLEALLADVLAENTAMLKVFDKSGFRQQKTREADVVHVCLHLP